MAVIHVDLRLADVEFEFWALELHLAALEENLIHLKTQDRIRTETKLKEAGLIDDEAEVSLAFQEHYQRVDHVLPRYLRGSFLVSLWAVLEAAIREVADYLRSQKKTELRLNDFRGDLLQRGEKYFKHILGQDFFPDAVTTETLRRVLILRNAYAHANGRLDSIYESDLPKIRKLLGANIEIFEDHGYVLLSKDFTANCLGAVRKTLAPLIAAVKLG